MKHNYRAPVDVGFCSSEELELKLILLSWCCMVESGNDLVGLALGSCRSRVGVVWVWNRDGDGNGNGD